MANKTDPIYTVSQLNRLAKQSLEGAFSRIMVEGEISNFTVPSSGHWYFTLKDEHAQIRCAMFRSRNARISFEPSNGMQIIAKGQVSLYEGRGDYQLIVDNLLDTGDGKLRLAFERLKIKLEEAGLFDAAHKKALPVLCDTIGVITSSTGAALHDILSVLKRRFPAIKVIIYPTQIQGKTAAPFIVNAIKKANQRKECDALILARGGGSLEDLWPFNEESVANAIFASKLPIVAGIGHETDFTIADYVADFRAPTPSAAAEALSPDAEEYQQTLWRLRQRLSQLTQRALSQQHQQLQWMIKRLHLQHPKQQLREQTQQVDQLEVRLQKTMLRQLQAHQQRLAHIAQTLQTLSPLATLARGYAITYNNNVLVKSVCDVKSGDTLTTKVTDGIIISIAST